MTFSVSKISAPTPVTPVPQRTPASGIFPLYLPENENPSTVSTAKHHTPELIRKVRNDLTRRTSDTNIVDKPESSRASRDISKSPGRRRKFSLGSSRARSSSLESGGKLSGPNLGSMPLPTVRKDSLSSSDSKKKDPKTFSMTIFVNESEKNKIVDLLHKAKSLISKKVEKVMGKKPNKASISNVDALQTVLESWMDREEEDEKEDDKLFQNLVKEQEKQVESMIQLGKQAPVQVPTLAVQEEDDVSEEDEDDDTIEEEPEYDLEVSRLTFPRYLRPPDIRRSRHVSDQVHSARSLSPVDNVPCPFGNRPESELYPPKLRRPSALYGAGALAASSRPPSRQVSVSPSVYQQDFETSTVASDIYDEEYEDDNETSSRYARPASFTVPIGGVWRPGVDDPEDTDVRWGTIPTEEEYLRSQEEGDCENGFHPLE